MVCSPPGFSVHWVLQARRLEWVAISFSRGSSWPRDWTWVSCTAGSFFTNWATREVPTDYNISQIFFKLYFLKFFKIYFWTLFCYCSFLYDGRERLYYLVLSRNFHGLPWWLRGKESSCHYRRYGFDSWVRKITWKRKWQPTPVFLPGKITWTEEPVRLQSLEWQRVRQDYTTIRKDLA